MNFIKGTILGMIAGTCLGYFGNDTIFHAMKKGEKELKVLLHLIFQTI